MELLKFTSPTLLTTLSIPPHKGIPDFQKFIPHDLPIVVVSSSNSVVATPDRTTLVVAAAALYSVATLDKQKVCSVPPAVLTLAIPDVPENSTLRQLLTRRILPGRSSGRLTRRILLPTVTA